jgi:hypothetical protein
MRRAAKGAGTMTTETGSAGAVVMTTIAAPNAVMRAIAEQCTRRGMQFVVVGDTKSPAEFSLSGCRYYSVDEQRATGLAFAAACPTRHYARKNIGYLIAMQAGLDYIVETDDDNMPADDFYVPLPRQGSYEAVTDSGWTNVYAYYDDRLIWPRGLPLDEIRAPLSPVGTARDVIVPIQQGLADENPDVDAAYRLMMPLPFYFQKRRRIALGSGAWCPYNSQNTIHYREAFPLLYLPAYCSFRMTDIWRSFVAQRIAWANGWSILFREATVVQDRNDHDLMRDFADEISGYLGNRKIQQRLDSLQIEPGAAAIPDALRSCYVALVEDGHVGAGELPLLDAWLADLAAIG